MDAKTYNPFREKAIRARAAADRANRPTAHEQGMAQSFPLGAGFGRAGGAKRIDASVNRAVEAVRLSREASYLESQAESFDAGKINAQGRSINAGSIARSIKREATKEKRDARIAAARAVRGDGPAWTVTHDVYATAAGILGGYDRKVTQYEHREKVAQAIADGLPVPAEVRAEYAPEPPQ